MLVEMIWGTMMSIFTMSKGVTSYDTFLADNSPYLVLGVLDFLEVSEDATCFFDSVISSTPPKFLFHGVGNFTPSRMEREMVVPLQYFCCWLSDVTIWRLGVFNSKRPSIFFLENSPFCAESWCLCTYLGGVIWLPMQWDILHPVLLIATLGNLFPW